MDFPIHTDTISIGLLIVYFIEGRKEEFSNLPCFSVPKVVLIQVNSADPDEMQYTVAFHLDLQCVPKYKGLNIEYFTKCSSY